MDAAYDPVSVAHAARIGFEMGADIVKTNYCGDVESFRHVVRSSPVPIVVAGGPKRESGSGGPLQMVHEIMEAGAAGVAIGRRVWQSEDPASTVRQIHQILFPAD
jgi:fructose-bisphosphate aldolase/2-amino-3,7-dideoxy-D-threo-hept-6-ulosonate synthase